MADFLKKMAQMLKQYAADAMPGGSLNPETQPVADRAKYMAGALDPNSQIANDLQGWHKKTQAGLADQLAGKDSPESQYAYQQVMNMAGVAPVGMIAYHGSPHKFDKFSLDKIGTGEGAQAYGHGLYLAESPQVAKQYQESLTNLYGTPTTIEGAGKSVPIPLWLADKIKQGGNIDTAISEWTQRAAEQRSAMKTSMQPWIQEGNAARFESELKNLQAIKAAGEGQVADAGALYKTDIPDEAVARFLDWDKPLSQQAPEVQAAIGLDKNPNASIKDMTGLEFYVGTGAKLGEPTSASKAAAEHLRKKGISGIRYLDGGSRSAGQGSSNFVAFDPDMIRILERNGQATGLEPWKPGEFPLKK